MEARSRSTVVGDSTTSAIWTLLSRVTGFGRVILIGAVLGPSYFGNLFQLANQFPWIVFELAIGALLGALLVPGLMTHISAGDLEATERLAGRFLGFVLAVFGAVTVVVMAGSFLIVRGLAAPIGDQAVRDDFIAAGVPLLLLTGPQLIGYGIAVTGQAVQQALGHFALPAAASIVENLVVIVTLIGFAARYGTGLEVGDVGLGPILLLGLGSSLGVAAHAALQWWGVHRLGIRLVPRRDWSSSDMRSIIDQARTSSGTAVLNGLRILVLIVAANTVAGGVVAFQLAINLLNLPVALGSKPVAFAILPRLSEARIAGDLRALVDIYARGVGMASFVSIPAAAASLTLGWFVAGGLAVGEMAGDDGERLILYALAGIAGAVIGEGLFQVATSAAYACTDPAGPLRAQGLRAALTALGAGICLVLVDGPVVILWLGLAMSAADLVGSGALHRRVMDLASSAYDLNRSLILTTLAAAVAFGGAAGAGIGYRAVWSEPQHQLAVLGVTGVIAAAAMVVFVLLRSRFDDELTALVAEFRHRGSARPTAGAS
ncbi:MAG: lipid II flippase MurJ [Actinomycetota bacterium]